MLCHTMLKSLLIGSMILLISGSVQAQNRLSNPGFELMGPKGLSTSFTGSANGGDSAAKSWPVWNNTASTTMTELLPATDTLSPGDQFMLHISTNGTDNGVYQFFTTTAPAYASVDVYVLSGQVQLSLVGSGGYNLHAAISMTTNTWERLNFSLPSGSNEIILYSNGGGANFYVDNVRVSSTPNPNAFVSGKLMLDNLVASAVAQLITFTFVPTDGSNPFPRTAPIKYTGEFVLPDVPKKAYLLHIKGAKWLAKNVVIDATQGEVTDIEATLRPGDANDDNHVNIFDLAILAEDFNSLPGDINWHEGRADFNCDNAVDIFDLAIMAAYFNQDGDANPVPTLTTLDPDTASQGGSDFLLSVTGTTILPGAVLLWGGEPRPTTVISSTLARAAIPASDLLRGGTVEITLTNSPPDGEPSNPLIFTVVNPAPTLTQISPNIVNAQSTDLTLSVTGSNFTPTSAVRWEGQNRTTTYLSPTQLQATIPATDLLAPGTFQITVATPSPGGGTSTSQSFTVAGIPQIALLTASAIRADGKVKVTVTLKNVGTATATGLRVKAAKLATATTTSTLPLLLSDLAPGATSPSFEILFPSSVATGDRVLTLTLNTVEKSYSVSRLVKVP